MSLKIIKLLDQVLFNSTKNKATFREVIFVLVRSGYP